MGIVVTLFAVVRMTARAKKVVASSLTTGGENLHRVLPRVKRARACAVRLLSEPTLRGASHSSSCVWNKKKEAEQEMAATEPATASSGGGGGGGGGGEACRICFEEDAGGGTLIEPCKCSGTLKSVHLRCLQRWQSQQLLSAASREAGGTREKGGVEDARVCISLSFLKCFEVLALRVCSSFVWKAS